MIHFEVSNLEKKLSELEAKTYEQDFWQNKEKSEPILKEMKIIKSKVALFNKIQNELTNLLELNELLQEEIKANKTKEDSKENHEIGAYNENLELVKELLSNTKNIEKDLETLEIETLFTGKYDTNNAIITLHSGAGGTEAQDWVEMLYRMYTRWAAANNFQVEEIDYLEGDGAGIDRKSVV